MSFFDQKEEVMKIELTPFGKQLLSKGQFKPEYYAFFDDDIIYDSNFFGVIEEQNKTEERILQETIISKPQITCVSRDTVSNQLLEHIGQKNKKLLVNTEIKDRSIPLGTSEIGKSYKPAWDIKFLKGQISSSTSFTNFNNTSNLVNIPQINLYDTVYKTEIIKNNLSNLSFNNPTTNIELEDGTILSVKEDYLLLEILEENVEDTKENFEIELFLVDGDESADGDNLIKLNFSAKQNNVVDGFLLDESELVKTEEFPDLDPSYVQHFFNILVDKEIDAKVITVATSNNAVEVQNTLIDSLQNTVSGNYRSNATEPFGKEC